MTKKLVDSSLTVGSKDINLKELPTVIAPECIDLLRIEVAIRNRAIVINKNGPDLIVIVDDRNDWDKMAVIKQILGGYNVTFRITSPDDMDFALREYYECQLVA